LESFGIRCISKYSPEKTTYLRQAYQVNRYPSLFERTTIANETGLSEAQVSKWFNNRRTKDSKLSKQI